MRRILLLVLGAFFTASGLFMLYDPMAWYGLVPGVRETGPYNHHFILDIGCAYLVTGISVAYFAFDARARFAALAGGAFLGLHALVHVSDALHGHSEHLLSELGAIYVPAILVLALTIPSMPALISFPLLKPLIRRQISKYERTYDYDTSYVRTILDADLRAFFKFARVSEIAHYNRGLPQDVWYAAKLTSTLAEDCGPCTQLGVKLAEEAGVAPVVLSAVLSGDDATMPDEVCLSVRFTRAVLAHDPLADDLRQEIVSRWGQAGLVSLSFAITSARLFPTTKYALGFGQSCQRVTVGGVVTPVLRNAA